MSHQEDSREGLDDDLAKEVAIAYAGPAIYSDRFYLKVNHAGGRLAFLEQGPAGSGPRFRAAVAMDHSGLRALRDLIDRLLPPPNEDDEQSNV